MTAVSVVVPVYQGAATLRRCLDALVSQKSDGLTIRIVVVDDGSTDGSADIARSIEGVTVTSIAHAGRAAALNEAIARAAGEVVLFTDADCEVPATWAADLVRILENDPALSGVGGNMLPRRMTAIETAKVLPYLHEFDGDRILEGTYVGACLNGNNMAIRRAALEEAGGFDPGYIHGADADLTRRLLETGHRLLRTAGSTVTHLKQDTFVTHLRTRFRRGSTVRFSMADGSARRSDPLRALARAVLAVPRDYARLARLRVLGRPVSVFARLLAPWVNLAGGAANAAGQWRYRRRFLKEGPVID